MDKRDCYEILGVGRDASSEEIKRCYRKLAMMYHPDRNPEDKTAEENFKEAAEAYSVLIDPEKRSLYDRFGWDGLRGEGFSGFSGFNSSIFSDFEDILGNFFGFGDIFGGSQRKHHVPRRGRDLALELEISLEESAEGVEKEIKLTRRETCPVCKGSKLKPGTKKIRCDRCQGRGQVRYQQGFFTISRSCSYCNGTGEIINTPCEECQGKGKVKKKRSLNVKIPAGIDEGMRLRICGEGEAGDEGAPAGDLFIVTRIQKHPFYERNGENLNCSISVSFPQAALGTIVEIPTLEGNELLKISPGLQSGEVLRLKGKGIKNLESSRKGDLFITVNVKTPQQITKEQKELLKQFAEAGGEKVEVVDRSIIDRVKNIFH
ncbi:MAG: molecular chaperone DnaJ [Candidatus Aminicenantes bacterium]|nr:molecular chaperone DnaJ [Candidatus Aminicenantes bacterium]